MAGSLAVATGRRLWSWVPLACRSFSLGVPGIYFVRVMVPPHKAVDRWKKKRAMFSVYDNIGILGNFEMHPKELIREPRWLRGWKGNDLQHCIRKKKMVRNWMFFDDLHNLNKRISYLYKHFNPRGKF
ncbi:39S ribosomal protein L51, mitochondrial-like [Artibeus jamaicensis]|uniref:39S ribosomal protein L51, mitochondrial-like n=1 Tax=Artibeus jamaicensis TaxID=9417 RepID=UPI00235AD35F|nr:39S ribosomal protein L51, mitochondrial-like [Artibeus jamaicensis]